MNRNFNYGSGDADILLDLYASIYERKTAFRERGEDQKIVELGNNINTDTPTPEPVKNPLVIRQETYITDEEFVNIWGRQIMGVLGTYGEETIIDIVFGNNEYAYVFKNFSISISSKEMWTSAPDKYNKFQVTISNNTITKLFIEIGGNTVINYEKQTSGTLIMDIDATDQAKTVVDEYGDDLIALFDEYETEAKIIVHYKKSRGKIATFTFSNFGMQHVEEGSAYSDTSSYDTANMTVTIINTGSRPISKTIHTLIIVGEDGSTLVEYQASR